MPTVIPMFQPRGDTIAELLMRQGDIAGRAALMRGQAWSNAIQGVGEAVAQGVKAWGQEKEQKKREQMLDAAMMEFDPADPRAFYRKAAVAVGPESAARLMTGLASMMKVGQGEPPNPADLKSVLGSLSAARKVYQDEGLAQRWGMMAPLLKKYEPLLGVTVPDQYAPEVGEWIDGTLAAMTEKKAPSQTVQWVRQADGTERPFVSNEGGQFVPAQGLPAKAPETKEPRKYQVTVPGPNGPITRLATEEEMLAGVREYQKPPSSLIVNPQAVEDRKENALSIVEGRMLPSTLSKRGGDFNALLAEASRLSREKYGKPFNFQKAQLDYEAAKRFVSAMNAPQMQRFKALAGSVVNTIDEVKHLAQELKQGGVQKFNKARRNSIMEVYGNTPQSAAAARYEAAVATLQEEFANLANGGYAPTDAAWHLAFKQINGDYGLKDFEASLTEVQRLINYRIGAFDDLTPTYLQGAPGENAEPWQAEVDRLFGGGR